MSRSSDLPDRQTFDRRVAAVQDRLDSGIADGVVCFPSSNLQYLTGIAETPGERHFLYLTPADGDPALLVPELSLADVRETVPETEIRSWGDDEDPLPAVRALIADRGVLEGRLLVDDTMWARFTQDLREAAPKATWGLANEVLGDVRARKDEVEIATIERASGITDAVVGDLRTLGSDAVGMTEAELAEWIDERLSDRGGETPAFETIVGSGPNGAKPHHHHSDRTIEVGDPVVLDFGTRVDGYPSDQTRTLVFGGDPTDRFREIHGIVRRAHQAGVEAIEPGVPASEIDRVVRSTIEAAGYGEAFIHRTGHGVGIDVHEEPYVVAGNERPLEAGMVLSVEPGIYLPDEFGVRIEDLVVVTEGGCRRLNHTDRGWSC
ncbi:aminopeptidase P family protein [Halopenitus sp. H-Gu1]|uniref:aminopeptidase P family protein n=1 Tax=Halopenitus sp. H-Gu1 TaxID=3242697 RepID=UPI00359D3918